MIRKLALAILLAAALGAPSTASALSIRDGSSWEPIVLGWSQYLQSHTGRLRELWEGWVRDYRNSRGGGGTYAAVPEPGAALLFGLGAAAVAAAARSRKRV